jgi:hypothetical protein
MRAARNIIPSMAALTAAALVASVAGWAALVAGPISLGPVTFGFSEAYDARGYALLLGSPSKAQIDRAETEARKALALSPYDNSARLRLAYIDTLRHGGLGAQGATLLAQSYDVLPIDQNVAAWRIRFGLEHWSDLSPETRAALHNEMLAFARAGSVDPPIRRILGAVRNPNGRLAAALWIHELDR